MNQISLTSKQQAAFFAKTESKGSCLIWKGATAGGRKNRYGVFKLSRPRRNEYAHRIAFTLYNERQISSGLYILHKCNTQLCVAARHLYEGTQKQNMKDFRNSGGSFVRTPKLTPKQVCLIKERLFDGESHAEIAEDYGVGRTTISQIARGATWKIV